MRSHVTSHISQYSSIVYSVGYHGKTLPSLMQLLENHKIELLVDVRSKPFSRYNPAFNRSNLERKLGRRYYWAGWCLGGLKGKRQQDYYGCLERLARQSQLMKICVMCMEENPAKCHRDMWIAKDLKARFNIDVHHL